MVYVGLKHVDPPGVSAAEWNKTRFAQTTFHSRAALNKRVPQLRNKCRSRFTHENRDILILFVLWRKQPPSLTLRAEYPLNEMGVKNKNVFEFLLKKRVFCLAHEFVAGRYGKCRWQKRFWFLLSLNKRNASNL